jgi:hypothetical protein
MVPIATVAAPLPVDLINAAEQLAGKLRKQYSLGDRLGFDLPDPLVLIFAPNKKPDADAWASPHADGAPGCDVTMPIPTLKKPGYNLHALAHEIFHCFQFWVLGNQYDAIRPKPGWLLDGSAEWAASEITHAHSSEWWPYYLRKPTTQLFTRTYDALGFYAHLTETGTNPYKVVPAMLTAANNEAAYAVSGATSDRFLDSWASGYFRGDVKGEDWDTTGPGITSDKAKPVRVTIARDDTEGQPFEVPAYKNSIYRLQSTADVLEVEVTEGSHVRISDGDTDATVVESGDFCLRDGGCTCPSGEGGDAPAAPLKPSSALAISGGTKGASATVTAIGLKELCCAGPSRAAQEDGLTIKPRVDCQKIGLRIEKDGDLEFKISFALLVDHPRLRPQFTKKHGKKTLTGLDLEGITGMTLDIGAGAANGTADNHKFKVDVPVEVDVPVRPRVRGLPASVKVSWRLLVDTGITGNNSTILGLGQYGLAGRLGVRNGTVAAAPDLSVQQSLIDSLGGITLGPSGIVIAVKTTFTGGAGTPKAMKGTFAALTVSFGVTNGSSLAFPLVICRGVDLNLIFAAGGGPLGDVKKTIFDRGQVVPDVNICQGGT